MMSQGFFKKWGAGIASCHTISCHTIMNIALFEAAYFF
jgi:hypothetical protein